MLRNQWKSSVSGSVLALLMLLNVIFLKSAFVEDGKYYLALVILLPLLAIALWDYSKK